MSKKSKIDQNTCLWPREAYFLFALSASDGRNLWKWKFVGEEEVSSEC